MIIPALHHIKTFFFQHMFCSSWLNYFGNTKTQGDTYVSTHERLWLCGTNVALAHVSNPTILLVYHPQYPYYLSRMGGLSTSTNDFKYEIIKGYLQTAYSVFPPYLWDVILDWLLELYPNNLSLGSLYDTRNPWACLQYGIYELGVSFFPIILHTDLFQLETWPLKLNVGHGHRLLCLPAWKPMDSNLQGIHHHACLSRGVGISIPKFISSNWY